MLLPLRVDVPMYRWPWMNWLIIAVTSVVSLGLMFAGTAEQIRPLVLDGWRVEGIFGSLLVHAGIIHLVGNMLFLWIFGNSVCAKVGNFQYLGLYLLFGLTAGASHLLLDGSPAIGASGAINGIVGMFLVFYPLNEITCFFLLFIVWGFRFTLSSVWMILLWLAFDIWGAVGGAGAVAYWAHLGGFAAGLGAGLALCQSGWLATRRSERSLVDVLKNTA